MDVSFIDRVKIQAEVLVPLIKALQKEFGKERVNALIPKALHDMYYQFGKEWWANTPGGPTEKIAKAIDMFSLDQEGQAIDVEELKRTDNQYDFNITKCRYADFFKQIGEPELGSLLVCGVDAPMTAGYGANVELVRDQTIMKGSSHCNFRYKVKDPSPTAKDRR